MLYLCLHQYQLAILAKIFRKNNRNYNIESNLNVLGIIELRLNCNGFIFKNTFYEQINATAMEAIPLNKNNRNHNAIF